MKAEKLTGAAEDAAFIPSAGSGQALQPSSLFVMRSGALGDFILTLPALQALRQKYPTHHLVLAARADVLPLVRGTLAHEVVPFDSALLTPLFTPDAELPDALQALFAHTDLAVVWLPKNSARIVVNNLRRLAVARLLSAPPPSFHGGGETNARHAADQLLGSLAPLGIAPFSPHPNPSPILRLRFILCHSPKGCLRANARGTGHGQGLGEGQPKVGERAFEATPHLLLSPAMRALGGEFWRRHGFDAQTRVIALHVGSGGAHKRWPLENFLSLAQRLSVLDNARVVWISGPAEPPGETSAASQAREFLHLDSPDLSLLASILARCSLYIGNDSGVTHLAAALGTRTIALFGPTDPRIWGPRGAHVTILRSPTARMEGLDVETVRFSAYRLLHIATSQPAISDSR